MCRARVAQRFLTLLLVAPAVAGLPALVVTASAAVPSVINYQGRLTDNTPQQNPVNGTLTLDFSIWDALVGGSSLWNETQSVQVTSGLFNAMLGQVTPIPPSVFGGGAERYLEIHVSGEPLSPRQRIAATPFANVAASADDAAGMGGIPAASWQKRIASACPSGMSINAVAADGTVTCVAAGSPGCLSGDCRTSWNNQDANSVNPMPRTCPAGQVAVSTGAFHWACSTICGFGSADCDNNANNGCEVSVATSTSNCGGCGVVCSANHVPTPLCSNVCVFGTADCDNNANNGCEVAIVTSTSNCGGCGIVCS
ncbi:MAG TPA: hypothetical protein VFQ07_17755, partial [Candidatus Polarisedimenticolia bacterium]|nr:hypothetical protein [Candidatus Polarisedimenticolia bacterium]